MHDSPARRRLETVFAGEESDRTPILGGWIACPEHICALAGIGLDEYWQEPAGASIRAYQELGADGLIDLFVPRGQADLVLFTANTINPDVPLENIRAMHEAVRSGDARDSSTGPGVEE